MNNGRIYRNFYETFVKFTFVYMYIHIYICIYNYIFTFVNLQISRLFIYRNSGYTKSCRNAFEALRRQILEVEKTLFFYHFFYCRHTLIKKTALWREIKLNNNIK